ncbi:TPA: minor capsid protein [Bacillus cereus]|uniref:phage tail terminator protein n=1 Tax=Bacillus TaxID=1386 RepID=UPI00077ABE8B|nr:MULTISPECIES: minor capsid protein [Bacillus]KXY95136.1 minor capsid protein [Bacillus cereus]SDJ69978.1 bacteriophage minor capsid protein [Bacillus sp. cl96]SEB14946.1 bacteriophage minor capsid protein [Bacillus sp. cl115]SHK26073.1 bacteriophage minor capsid protein [Bacillus sp. cl25]HDR8199934.1 minor capsid protein [Bacillus cereus]
MIWLIESVKKHLIATLPQGILFAPIKADLLDIGVNDAPRKSIAIRMVPSAPGEQYYDGEIINKQIQILAKSSNQLEVNNTMEFITRELNNVHRRVFHALDNSYKLIRLNVYVEPNFVEKTTANEYIMTALFSVELCYN